LTFEGHLLEWEWVHVGETVQLFDGASAPPATISSQNLYRMLGAYAISAMRKPLGGIYPAALGSTVLFWVAAAAAVFGLTKLVTGSQEVAVLAAALAGTAPGFVGYLANVDPHPAGYAAVAVWLFAVERWSLIDAAPARPWRDASPWSGPILAGLLLCVASFALEVAYPLLLAAWVFYGLRTLRGSSSVVAALSRLALMTVVFGAGHYGFKLLAERALFEQVIAMNEPHTALGGSLARIRDDGFFGWLAAQWPHQPLRWLAAFPPLVTACAVVGWCSVSTRWRVWSATVVGSFLAAVLVTKPATRTMYLSYPAVYVLAAYGMARLGQVAAARLPIASAATINRHVQWAIASALLIAAVATTNADLWGDYSIPVRWYGTQ
jgi:hypothetical protein